MGKKSAPQPIIQADTSTTPAVDRTELDKITKEQMSKAEKARASTKEGVETPQASLLAERDYWKKKESLLKG